MIRFIDLTGQIDENFKFAWFDTVTEHFFYFDGGTQIFETWDEFKESFSSSIIWKNINIERFKKLFPKDDF